ncbi:hypothetical protein N7499_002132 [Penicillium canescens]|nr:hypothetical protein N7499_002132 [Penicillium canescens]KAJ6165747.1 hypothetical protein N7485_008991 [Penicillium canescens]
MMPRKLRSGCKELPASKMDGLSLQDEMHEPHEAGTAVCIDSRGWILTCAHCFGETPEEWKAERLKWLLYYNGLAVQVECRAWDERRDLALAKIVRIEIFDERCRRSVTPIFACVPIAESMSTSSSIFCIGQPGADDLESVSPRKTAYDLVELSQGRLCGMVAGADPQDNSDIGALKHNAWTYWGHSGAPLLGDRTVPCWAYIPHGTMPRRCVMECP